MTEVPIRPAATVILVRDAEAGLETLLLRRSAALVFHGGAWVFPGGRIDEADYQGAVIPQDPSHPDHEHAARRAAVREAYEEAALRLAPDDLIPFAHWITPPGRPRRFSTWFYLAAAGEGEITTDGGEITDHRWARPNDALRLKEAGEIELPRPTLASLQRLGACATVADALREAREGTYTRVRPED